MDSVVNLCYHVTIIITVEIEYEEGLGFIKKEISTADYSLLQKNSEFHLKFFKVAFACLETII